jgi:hypothetical protein
VGFRAVRNNLRQRRLPAAGWPPQNQRKELIIRNRSPEQFAFTDKMMLSNELFECARAHTGSQWRLLLQRLLSLGIEQSCSSWFRWHSQRFGKSLVVLSLIVAYSANWPVLV